MMRSASTATVAAGLALGLLLSGCGDSKKEAASPTGNDAGAGSTSKLSGDPIKLFSIQQITVTNQDSTAEAGDAIKASVKRINAEGGINGHPVTVEVCDDKFSPAEGASCARKATTGGYAAVVGTTTQQGDAIYPVLEKAGMCNFAPQPINRLDYSSKASFPILAGGPVNVAAYPAALKAVGAKKIGVAYIDVPTAAGVVPFIDLGAKAAGVTVGRKVPIPITTTDISSVVASTVKGNDGAALIVAPAQLSAFLRGLSQSGSKAYAAASAADDKLIAKLGDASKNLVVTGAFVSTSSDAAGMKKFNADMDAENKDAERNAFSVNSWLGAQALKEILETQKVTAYDPKTVCAALSKATDVSLMGMAPAWSSAKPFPIPGLERIFNPFVQLQKVENGTLVPIGDGKFIDPLDPSAVPGAL